MSAIVPHQFPPNYLLQLIESSPDIVVAVDRTGIIVFYNDGAEKTLGYSAQEVLGKNVSTIYPTLEEGRRVMQAMRSQDFGGPGKLKNFETTFVDRWGAMLPVAISGSILSDEAGLEIGSIGFAKDIRDIRRKDRLATLGEVTVAVCHEINNPLEVIMNQVELLDHFVQEAASDARILVEEERIEAIRREVSRIQQSISKLVAMSRGSTYETTEYHDGTQMAALGPSSRPCASLAGIRILVVDDDLGVCRSVRDLLAEEGAEVSIASNGLEALRVFDRMPVDVIVSDVVMPDLDGYDLYMEIKKRGDTPVLLMTGFHHDVDHIIKRSRVEGLRGVLFKKPVDPVRLKTMIREMVKRSPGPVSAHASV